MGVGAFRRVGDQTTTFFIFCLVSSINMGTRTHDTRCTVLTRTPVVAKRTPHLINQVCCFFCQVHKIDNRNALKCTTCPMSIHQSTGLFLSMRYEAVKNSTKHTAICNVDVWETLRGDITLEVNSCDFTVKAGTPTAEFVDPWTEGFNQDSTGTVARSAVIAAKGHYFPDQTVVYSCSVWITPKTLSHTHPPGVWGTGKDGKEGTCKRRVFASRE